MIVNITDRDIQRSVNKGIVNMFHTSSVKFYLTGSRYFGGATNYSDYDFFAAHNSEVKAFLRNRAFVPSRESYLDGALIPYGELSSGIQKSIDPQKCKNVADVWVGEIAGFKIHVQLVTDPIFKQTIQEVLKKNVKMHLITKLLGKDNMVCLWNLFYELAQMNGGKSNDNEIEALKSKISKLEALVEAFNKQQEEDLKQPEPLMNELMG